MGAVAVDLIIMAHLRRLRPLNNLREVSVLLLQGVRDKNPEAIAHFMLQQRNMLPVRQNLAIQQAVRVALLEQALFVFQAGAILRIVDHVRFVRLAAVLDLAQV